MYASLPLISTADERYASGDLDFILERVNAAVIGPGLSRDPIYVDLALKICEYLAEKKTPMIFDGVYLAIPILTLGWYSSFPNTPPSLRKMSFCDNTKRSRA